MLHYGHQCIHVCCVCIRSFVCFVFLGLMFEIWSAGKSSESLQCAMLKACDACADMGQL